MHPDPNPDPRPPATDDDSAVDLTATSTATHVIGTTPTQQPVSPAGPGGDPVPGSRLGQYRLVRVLGAGGMGIVYEAEDEWLGRRVAVKVLRSGLPAESIAHERFLREARATAAIDHPNVVTVYQVGLSDGRPYMAMQLLSGETLETRLGREPRLSPAEAARIGGEIAAGLGAAHARGLVHRDVKPSNVWLEADGGRVKLLDFGLALAGDSDLTHTGFVIGTPAFMSPEQARGEPVDGRSDLFCLGTLLYLMTTGDRPFAGPTAMAVMRNLDQHVPARVNVKRADVPAPLSNLIMELLAKDPKDRPPAAEVVAARLARPEMTRLSHVPVAPPHLPDREPVPFELGGGEPGWYAEPPPASPLVRILTLLTLAAAGLGGYGYYAATNYGRLDIDSDAADAEVHVRQGGQLRHAAVGPGALEVRPGTYELVLARPHGGYRLSRTVVEVRRNGRATVRVVRDRL
jgi:serine/threonine protein kinase